MIVLRDRTYSSSLKDDIKENLDDVSKKYAAGAVGAAIPAGYLLKTSGKKSFRKKIKPLLDKFVYPEEIHRKADEWVKKLRSGEMSAEQVDRETKVIDQNNINIKRSIGKAKRGSKLRGTLGRGLTAVSLGLGAAAGYRYYKNKQRKNNNIK